MIDQTYQQLFRQQYGLEGKEEVKAFFGKKGRKRFMPWSKRKRGFFFHPPHLYLASLVLDVCRDQNIYVGNCFWKLFLPGGSLNPVFIYWNNYLNSIIREMPKMLSKVHCHTKSNIWNWQTKGLNYCTIAKINTLMTFPLFS